MPRAALLVLLLLALGAGAWLLLREPGEAWPSEPATAVVPRPGTRVADGAPAPGPRPEAARRLSTPDAPPPAAGNAGPSDGSGIPAWVGVVLRQADRSPVPGVAVTLVERPRPARPRVLTTDVHGRFVVPADGPARWSGFHVAAGPDSGAALHWGAQRADAPPDRPEVLLVPGPQAVSGTVRDGTGQPVAGATVRGWSWSLSSLPDDGRLPPAEVELVSDGAGRFALASLGPEFLLEASAPGRVCVQRAQGRLEAGRSDGVELVLEDAVPLEGQVLTHEGAPVPGVEVLARHERRLGGDLITALPGVYRAGPASTRTRTDGAGRFRFDGLAARPVTLVVSPADRPPLERVWDPADGPVELRLDPGARLVGRVLGPDGAALEGATLTLLSPEGAYRTTVSAADGGFLLEGLPASTRARLDVQAPGCAVQVVQPLVLDPLVEARATVRLEDEAPLAGRLTDADGRPLAGVPLSVEGQRVVDLGGTVVFPTPTWERVLGRAETRTDGEGRFRFERLYPGEFVLTAELPAGVDAAPDEEPEARPARQRRWTVVSGQEDLLLSTSALGAGAVRLVGTVLDAMTGLPVSSFRVSALRPVGASAFGGPERAVADPSGHFTWGGLEPGALRVKVHADGYQDLLLPVADYGPGDHALDLRLRPLRSLTLGVLDEQGAPHGEVLLTFADEDGATLMIDLGTGATSALVSDEQGLATAHGLPAGPLVVRAWPLDGATPLVPEDERPSFRFDLWEQPSGVQWITVPRDEPAPRRTLRVSVLGHGPGTLPPAEPADPEGEQALRALVEAGRLWPLRGQAVVLLRDADGTLLERVELAGDGQGAYVITRDGHARSEPYPTVLLRAPLELVELLVESGGRTVARWALEAGQEQANLFAFVEEPG